MARYHRGAHRRTYMRQPIVGNLALLLLAMTFLLLPYPMRAIVLSGTPITAHWQDVSQAQACGGGVEPGATVACWIPEPSSVNEG